MSRVGDSMKLQNRHPATLGLTSRLDQIVHRPFRPRIPGGWQQQRMIAARLIRHTTPAVIRKFRRTTTTRQHNAVSPQHIKCLRSPRVARPRQRHRSRNAVLPATTLNPRQLLLQLTHRLIQGARQLGYEVINDNDFPIVCVVVGKTPDVIQACKILWEYGILITPALYPIVPKDKGLLRFSITAANTEEEIDRSLDALAAVRTRVWEPEYAGQH